MEATGGQGFVLPMSPQHAQEKHTEYQGHYKSIDKECQHWQQPRNHQEKCQCRHGVLGKNVTHEMVHDVGATEWDPEND